MYEYISLGLFVLGFFSFFLGLMKMIYEGGKRLYTWCAILGGILIAAAIGIAIYTNQQGNESLLQDIAEQLNANTADIILEDISEDKLLEPSKNINLRKVYYKDKIYILEVKDYEIIKMIEQK